jgi:hypothetical protein
MVWVSWQISSGVRVYQYGSHEVAPRTLQERDSLKKFHFEELLLRSSERSVNDPQVKYIESRCMSQTYITGRQGAANY